MDSSIKIIDNLRKLEKLNLNGATVTDNALQYICSLKKLAYQDCKGITESGLRRFIESSPKLELLDVTGCKNINRL